MWHVRIVVFAGRCETDYVRLYLDVDGVGVNELSDWTVQLCGNDTQNSSDFYSSTSHAILELHTSHRRRHRNQRQQPQQQQLRRSRRPRFRGFRGTFRFLLKGQ